MDNLRDRLARRLRALMDATPSLDTQVKVSKKAKVSQSTVQRVLSRDVPATLDVVEDLGRAFGLKPPSLILSDEAEAKMLQAWLTLNTMGRDEVQRFAVDLVEKNRTAKAQLTFELKREVPAPLQVANMRASSRLPQQSETKVCPPDGKSSKSQSPANSSPSPAPKRRIRSV